MAGFFFEDFLQDVSFEPLLGIHALEPDILSFQLLHA